MRFRSGALAGRTTLLGKTAEGTAEVDPVALGLKPGSTLVVWAEARDTNTLDGPGLGRSDVAPPPLGGGGGGLHRHGQRCAPAAALRPAE